MTAPIPVPLPQNDGLGTVDRIKMLMALGVLNQKVEDFITHLEKPKSLQEYLWEEAGRDTSQYIQTLSRYHGKHVPSQFLVKDEIWSETIRHIEPWEDAYGLEFGVFSGQSINFFADRLRMPFYGFDSFEGLPESDSIWEQKTFSLPGLPKVPPHVSLIKGWFSDTLPGFIQKNNLADRKLAYLHIDCDLYSSTVTVLDHIGAQIVPGTVILFDEYWNYPGWRHGEFKAWQEFVDRTGVTYEHLCYDNHEQLAIKITARP